MMEKLKSSEQLVEGERLHHHRSKHDFLREIFGYDSFKPNEETVIDTQSCGRNVLAVIPTGSGKSICYQVPALMHEGLIVVISPVIALMGGQVSVLKLAVVDADRINLSSD